MSSAWHGRLYASRPRSGSKWFSEALEIRDRHSLSEDLAKTRVNMGNLYLVRGELEAAQDMFEKALPVFEQSDMKAETAGVFHGLGMIAEHQRDYKKAVDLYKYAVDIALSIGHTDQASASMWHLAKTGFIQAEYTSSLQLAALSLYPTISSGSQIDPNKLGILAMIMNRIGVEYFESQWRLVFQDETKIPCFR